MLKGLALDYFYINQLSEYKDRSYVVTRRRRVVVVSLISHPYGD